jgi:hypothetical protein
MKIRKLRTKKSFLSLAPGSGWSCAASGFRQSSSQCWSGARLSLSSEDSLLTKAHAQLKLEQMYRGRFDEQKAHA